MNDAKMKKWAIIGVAVLLALIYVGSVFGYRGDCVRLEAAIKAQYKQNQNNYDHMWKKFKEVASVPAMYVEDMKKLWDDTMKGRYGAEGSKAAMQFIHEHNPNIDASMYTRIQATIEAGRNSFMAEQQSLLDKKREYETVLKGNRSVYSGMWFNFPTIDLDKFDIVISDKTEEVFSTKKDNDPIKLR